MGSASDRLRMVGGLATLVVGAIHLQQYADFIKDVPTISTLFLLNGFGAGLVSLLLATRVRALAAVGGIAIAAGALISLAIARYASSGVFGYVEPTFRGPVLISVVAEVIVVLSLAGYLGVGARFSVGGRPRAARRERAGPDARRAAGG